MPGFLTKKPHSSFDLCFDIVVVGHNTCLLPDPGFLGQKGLCGTGNEGVYPAKAGYNIRESLVEHAIAEALNQNSHIAKR